jgi:Carboxypeptidase regulatory-like domain
MRLGYPRISLVFTLFFAALCWGQSAGSGRQIPPSIEPQAEGKSGTVVGTVIDPTGAVVPKAQVRLTPGRFKNQDVVSDDHGQFFFPNVEPGGFQLTITSAGFAPQKFSGVLDPGETQTVPPIMLSVASASTTVEAVTETEVAEQQMKEEEKQRVLGIVPDFYVSFVPHAAPLNPRQKFDLAWKSTADPFTFFLAGALAGAEQADNYFSGYGQGAEGYAKRFGASYAGAVSGTFIGDAILASVLKQDPRYFYKGAGTARSRILYAMANAFICKGDNGHWQPNYSHILGDLAANGIANLYYPASDRRGASLTFQTTAIGIGGTMAANLFQEFVVRKFTPRVHGVDPQNH